MEEDKVKWHSKKKYPCKRGKGEHEWGEPLIKFKPEVRYTYRFERGTLDSSDLQPEYKLTRAEVKVVLETRCKNCNKKAVSYLSQKL